MTQEELYNLLCTSGLEVYYGHYTGQHALPYLIYRYKMSDYDQADDINNYVNRERWDVQLYTAHKDPATEKKLETVLDGISYDKYEYEIDNEQTIEILYELSILGG
jgi:hypothetical protein